MKTVIVTKKGSEMKSNSWKEGQEISIHENIAEYYILKGIATDPESEQVTKKVTTSKKPKQ